MRLTLYTKDCCHLCEDAIAALERVRREIPFDVEYVDITSDPDLFERYRHLIPVLVHEGEELFYGKVSAHRLKEMLRSAGEASDRRGSLLSPRYKAYLKQLRALLANGRDRPQSP